MNEVLSSALYGGWPTLSTILTVPGALVLSRFLRLGGDFDFLDLGRNVRNVSGCGGGDVSRRRLSPANKLDCPLPGHLPMREGNLNWARVVESHPSAKYALGWGTRRFYDFSVWTEHKRIEKLRYMHRNPVKRGLVESPEFWRWSSYRAYFLGESGPVKINEWEVLKMKMRSPAA